MRRTLAILAVGLVAIPISLKASPHSRPAPPMTGTWTCIAHGTGQGPVPFTLDLQQTGTSVTGGVTSPLGDAPIAEGSFAHSILTIDIDGNDGTYHLTAKLTHGVLQGHWTYTNSAGTWHGKKETSRKQIEAK